MIQPFLQTPRLTLIRLTDTTLGSSHAQWYHQTWTDPDATSWSLRGMSKSPEQSVTWLTENLEQYDNLIYCVFIKDVEGQDATEDNPGTIIGSVSLRRQHAGPAAPPPELSDRDKGKELDLRVIGYGLFKAGWGKGYATEANRALLDAHAAAVAEEKALGNKVFYIEAGVDEGNPGSTAVVTKLGLKKVGFKVEKEPVYLGGDWRYGGYWIYGKYV